MNNPNTSGEKATLSENKLFLTSRETARRLGVSVRTLRRLRIMGMPSYGRGRMLRFSEKEAAEWLKRYLLAENQD